MKYSYVAEGIDAVIIDDFYTEEQMAEIETELKWLTKKSIMMDENGLAPAEYDGVVQTSKSGVFLESVFVNWKHSALISGLIKNMDTAQFRDELLSFNTMYKSLFSCNVRSHLLSYYENADYYRPHIDNAFFTALNYFVKEPKQFSGGEIVLKSCNSPKEATIEIINNRVVIIPSCTVHEVKPIVSSMQNTLSGNGRYCNSAFLTLSDKRKEDKNDSN